MTGWNDLSQFVVIAGKQYVFKIEINLSYKSKTGSKGERWMPWLERAMKDVVRLRKVSGR